MVALGVDLGNLAQAYNALYQVGVRGEHILKAKNPYISMLTPEQVGLAYTYGQMDGLLERGRNKNSPEVLQNDGGSGTIKENAQEDTEYERGEETGGVRLRDGGERDQGEDTGGQVSEVEGDAGQDQSRRKGRTEPRDLEAASGLDLREEVTAKSLGIKGGLDSGKVYLIDESSETASMKKARELGEARGLEVVFYAGGDLHVLKKNEVVEAEGYIEGDRVYVRADHPDFTADQIMRHEIGHDMIDRGEVYPDEVRKRIEDRFGEKNVKTIADAYVVAYSETEMEEDDIWEEIICDSLGDMNIFDSFKDMEKVGELNSAFLYNLKEETLKSKKDVRGPPKNSKGKASRTNLSYTQQQYNNFGWVRANNVLNAGYWKNFTENFAQAVVGNYTYPKTKNGEFMIDVYDAYDDSGITNVVVFASGTIENPKVTQIIKINSTDPTEIEYERRDIIEAGRRGIQQTAGEFFRFYHKTDSIGELVYERNSTQKNRNSGGPHTKRRGSEIKTDPIVKFHIDEEKGTITITYSNGEIVTENLNSGKASRNLDFINFLKENAEENVAAGETVEEKELSNREILANTLESEDMSPSEKGFLTKYKETKPHASKTSKGEMIVPVWIDQEGYGRSV